MRARVAESRAAFADGGALALVVGSLGELRSAAAWDHLEVVLRVIANFCKDGRRPVLLACCSRPVVPA